MTYGNTIYVEAQDALHKWYSNLDCANFRTNQTLKGDKDYCATFYFSVYQPFTSMTANGPNNFSQPIRDWTCNSVAQSNELYDCTSNQFCIQNFNHPYLSAAQNQTLIDKYNIRMVIKGWSPTGPYFQTIKKFPFTGVPGGNTCINYSALGLPASSDYGYEVRIIMYHDTDVNTVDAIDHSFYDFAFDFELDHALQQEIVRQSTVLNRANLSGPLQSELINNFNSAPGKSITIGNLVNFVNVDWSAQIPNNVDLWNVELQEVNCVTGAPIGNLLSLNTPQTTPPSGSSEFITTGSSSFNEPNLIGKCFRTTFWIENECGRASESEFFKATGFYFQEQEPEIESRNSGNIIDLFIYPNPAHEVINIIYSTKGIYDFQLIDIMGKTILTRSNLEGDLRHIVETSGVTPGIYMVKVTPHTAGEKPQTSKIIIQ